MTGTIRRLGRTVVGVAQWMGGRPITEPAVPRLALSNWTAALRDAGFPIPPGVTPPPPCGEPMGAPATGKASSSSQAARTARTFRSTTSRSSCPAPMGSWR